VKTTADLSLLTFPMHGQRKLLEEGYRTRDGHMIEWFGRHLEGQSRVEVISRPEPFLRPAKPLSGTPARNTVSVESRTLRVPKLTDKRHWWVRSAGAYPALDSVAAGAPAVVWNPFVALASRASNPFLSEGKVVLDLLDDWTVHYAFSTIREQVEKAYAAAFEAADHVTANAEGTAELARRFGRDDVHLIPNGVDPERFSTMSAASGPMTVGYVGKIGRRLDLDGIVDTIRELPSVSFVFAGPILDDEYRNPLSELPNVTLLGDVHYEEVPALLTSFDVGWVPHRVGDGEVGGDVIKTYEYRAAGLPVLTTPVVGSSSRGLSNVNVAMMEEHKVWLHSINARGPRVERQIAETPSDQTWQRKSAFVLALLERGPLHAS
jgi:glycosyltransferase involved in cell wall biosynthesis